ncbi:MAG TPA: NotI family restriction endonuclease [bacterium]
MAKKVYESRRFGIGEWYGRRFETIAASDRIRYATLTGINKEPCPHRPGKEMCNKNGGVCSLATYQKDEDGAVRLVTDDPGLVTLCPMRFWQNYTVFKEVGSFVLGTDKPALIKEISFLRSLNKEGEISNETVGRIDMVLAKAETNNRIDDWCALEMQAVYFSGESMKKEFKMIEEQPAKLFFPTAIRRPDFRSSGPKRLMPQLQIKVPSLRRWGKKMAVVVDREFYASIAPMKEETNISNADIAWFVVNYDGPNGELRLDVIVLTTLESSVEGLTAGVPVTKEEFERELSSYLVTKNDKVVRLS